MIKVNFRKIWILFFYCIPYFFISMNEDATYGTMWFYIITIISNSILCFICVKHKICYIMVLGNIMSFISSYIFILFFKNEKWIWYFKPYTPFSLLVFLSLISVIVQIIFYIIKTKKSSWHIIWCVLNWIHEDLSYVLLLGLPLPCENQEVFCLL